MKLYFYIDYLASPGERLALNILNSDEGEVRTTVRMQPADNAHWTCSIETEGESYIDYFYSVIDRKAKIAIADEHPEGFYILLKGSNSTRLHQLPALL